MPRRELEVRVIANTAEVALGRLDGTSEDAAPLDSRDWQRISAQRPKWGTTPLAITDRPGMTLTDVKSHARSVARRKPLARSEERRVGKGAKPRINQHAT